VLHYVINNQCSDANNTNKTGRKLRWPVACFVHLVSDEIFITTFSEPIPQYVVFTNLALIRVNYSVNNHHVATVAVEEAIMGM
jgi:hypothetical protein